MCGGVNTQECRRSLAGRANHIVIGLVTIAIGSALRWTVSTAIMGRTTGVGGCGEVGAGAAGGPLLSDGEVLMVWFLCSEDEKQKGREDDDRGKSPNLNLDHQSQR